MIPFTGDGEAMNNQRSLKVFGIVCILLLAYVTVWLVFSLLVLLKTQF